MYSTSALTALTMKFDVVFLGGCERGLLPLRLPGSGPDCGGLSGLARPDSGPALARQAAYAEHRSVKIAWHQSVDTRYNGAEAYRA